jgi:multidrug transporter EmrE-like cation transporter
MLKGVFGSVIVVVFQNVFRSEMHETNFIFIFLIIFGISTLKRSKT